MGNMEKLWINYGFFRNYCNLWNQSLYMQSRKWVNEVRWVSKIKIIPWPWPKVTQIPELKLVFLRNYWAIWNQISNESFWEHGNVILFNSFWSHDTDGCHAHTCTRWKPLWKIFFCQTNWLIVLNFSMQHMQLQQKMIPNLYSHDFPCRLELWGRTQTPHSPNWLLFW